MNKKQRYLVTSALPYANGYVHVGHIAGAYLPADIYVRFRRLNNDDIIFVSGSDEHGTAIEMASILENVTPQEIIDRYHFSNKEAFQKLGIDFDIFSRTSNKIHHETSREFFLTLYNKGILIKKTEDQLYSNKEKRFLADRFVTGTCPVCGFEGARGDECENCGSNISPLELKNPKSKITGDTPVVKESTHFYIPLGKYQEKLTDWIFSKSDWKQNVINYCKGWLKSGLRDRAITRDLDWGVRVPLNGYEGKVIYVWFEAPIGYISATKELFIERRQPEKWKEYWCNPDTRLIHFIGKDNIVFHSLIFPAMLMAHGDFVLPYNVPANEFLLEEGDKLSKSRGRGILVKDILSRFDPDVVRYTLASNMPENRDSDFSWKDLQSRNNNELAAILGNFINRTVVFAKSKFSNKVPSRGDANENDERILVYLKQHSEIIAGHFDMFKFKDALNETMNIVRSANKYFNDSEPWRILKEDEIRCASIINNCLQICYSISILIYPFLPFTSEKILKILNADKSNFAWGKIGDVFLKDGVELGENEILFPQIEDKQIEEELSKAARPESEEKLDHPGLISIDDFRKVRLKVAKVLECQTVPKSKKLLKLRLKIGDKEKQIVSGISEYYKPEDLLGKLIVVVDNLVPSKLMGIHSEGMLLAAKQNGELRIVTIDGTIPEGAEVS